MFTETTGLFLTGCQIVRKLCSMFGFVQKTTHSNGGWHVQFEDRSEAFLAHNVSMPNFLS